MDGRIFAAAPLALVNQLPLPRLSKRAVLGLPCKWRYMRTRPLPLNWLTLVLFRQDKIGRRYYWKNYSVDVEHWAVTCLPCQKQHKLAKKGAELHPVNIGIESFCDRPCGS